MKLHILAPVSKVQITDTPNESRPAFRPVISRPAALAVAVAGAMMAQEETQAETVPPVVEQPAALTCPPLTMEGRALLRTAFEVSKGAPGRYPLLLEAVPEIKDDFKRVYAVAAMAESLALSKGVETLQRQVDRLEKLGVRLGLYISGEAQPALVNHGGRWCWQRSGKYEYVIYPRQGSLTEEWAVEVYREISARVAIVETGIFIEFPTA